MIDRLIILQLANVGQCHLDLFNYFLNQAAGRPIGILIPQIKYITLLKLLNYRPVKL
jgi:hypothetical protein